MPFAASQMRAVWSTDVATMRDPSGLKAADITSSSCPRRTASSVPLVTSQMRAVLRSGYDPAVTMRDASGLKAAELSETHCDGRTASSLPFAASHSLVTDLATNDVTMRDPSGLKEG